jgi:hypothetical protein
MDFASRLGDVTGKVRVFADKGKELSEKGKAKLLLPPVLFGAPLQLATDAQMSWWHVPVFIRPLAIHRKALEGCRVKLIACDSGGSALDMRWHVQKGMLPVSLSNLVEGRLYLVPVAARKESARKRVAVITNESFFAQKKARVQVPTGRSRWLLRVANAERSWDSEETYALNVPPPDRGNGHFTFEVCYDRVG